ncbi:transposase [Profundibacterium mesophilum]|uniref:Glutamyl-tRNA synthetase n=1 Tax=Profundibacterium mesophilum KAUST100406-0324 TaxID=1037889 RepID=A0A921NXH5_9RHOB|nr:transposase [Profundibacterium mesophilum]KAF0677156.1 glutamyl-tRNA synthetase [Profundibacterium mesophilum KAUST100406-0324]
MKRSRFTEERIIGMLEQEAWLSTAEMGRKHGVSQATFHRYKARFGGLDVSDARRACGRSKTRTSSSGSCGPSRCSTTLSCGMSRQRKWERPVSGGRRWLLPASHGVRQRRACQALAMDGSIEHALLQRSARLSIGQHRFGCLEARKSACNSLVRVWS